MDEGKYELAEETGDQVAYIRPELPVAVSAVPTLRSLCHHHQALELRVSRQRGVVDTLDQWSWPIFRFPTMSRSFTHLRRFGRADPAP